MCLFQWSFSADILVVDPDHIYTVSVYNIPKPELSHSNYNVNTLVTVSGEFLLVGLGSSQFSVQVPGSLRDLWYHLHDAHCPPDPRRLSREDYETHTSLHRTR